MFLQYCDNEHKTSMISSFFFIGAFLGLQTATTMFDMIGRKRTTLFAIMISIGSTLGMAFVQTPTQLIVVRVIQGFGVFIQVTGLYVWGLEYTPSRLRNAGSVIGGSHWTFGMLTSTLVSYLTVEWRHNAMIVSAITLVLMTPLLFLPESPRFNLIKGKEDEAKRTLQTYSRIFNKPISFEKVTLVFEDHQQSYLEQLKDFLKYK